MLPRRARPVAGDLELLAHPGGVAARDQQLRLPAWLVLGSWFLLQYMYAQGGGLSDERRQFREGIRIMAAERFGAGEPSSAIARELRVSVRSVQRWRRLWDKGGPRALRSAGSASVPRLSQAQFAQLEAELAQFYAAVGLDGMARGKTPEENSEELMAAVARRMRRGSRRRYRHVRREGVTRRVTARGTLPT